MNLRQRLQFIPVLVLLSGALGFFLLIGDTGFGARTCSGTTTGSARGGFTGSSSCRECHEKFYQLWAPSHHGLAMQPYTAAFAGKELQPPENPIVIGKFGYRAAIGRPKRI